MAKGTVYVGRKDTSVYTLIARTERKQWSFETGSRVYSSPAVASGTVYVGSDDHSVYALTEE